MNSFQLGIIKALEEGPWSDWELCIISKDINKYPYGVELTILSNEGFVIKTKDRAFDPVTRRSCSRYALTKKGLRLL